jgi:polyisoprenoid-binding protein YceI
MANTTWAIDASHSEIQFKVKHLVITTVTGSFNEFSGSVTAEEGFENANISFEANVASINTNSEQRDGHLKSADFFDAEQFPTLSFTSTTFSKNADDEFSLTGDLTIKGTTLPVTLSVEYGGTATDPWGNVKAGFELTGKINRKDFGLTWNAITETGGALVSEEVKLVANVQLVKQG